MNAKNRRHSGRVTPRWSGKGKYAEEIAEGNEPQVFWDDWMDRRDGLRWDADVTHLRSPLRGYNKNWFEPEIIQANKKIKKQIAIRKAKKLKARN